MKPIFGCFTVLIFLVTTSKPCLNPLTISPTTSHRRAKFSVVPKIPEFDGASPQSYMFLDVSIYTLNQDPLVQYALIEREDMAFVLQLKQTYKNDSNKEFWSTEYDGQIEFSDFEETNANESHQFLQNYGTFKGSALRDMKRQCELYILQNNIKKILFYLTAVGVMILVYIVYMVFNFMINFGTLRKLSEISILRSFYNSLSQSLTSRQISNHYHLASEKMYVNIYTKMDLLDKKIKNVEESTRFEYMPSKNSATLHYDYVDKNQCKNWNNLGKNNSKSGYLTPNNSIIRRE